MLENKGMISIKLANEQKLLIFKESGFLSI